MPKYEPTPRVLSIQSHVVHGYVGNKSAVFPLQVLGFEVDPLNTTQYSNHTGYKHFNGNVMSREEMPVIIDCLAQNKIDGYNYLITGYSNKPDVLSETAKVVRKLKVANPNLIYVCDPVMGDDGKLYVPDTILPVYIKEIIPLADIITPNQFEAEIITNMKAGTFDDSLKMIKKLHEMGVKVVALSSTNFGKENSMLSIVSDGESIYQLEIPKIDAKYTGTGDLFAALFLAWYHKTSRDIKSTLENTIATLQTVVRDTFEYAREQQPSGKLAPSLMELRLIQNREAISSPRVAISCEKIAG